MNVSIFNASILYLLRKHASCARVYRNGILLFNSRTDSSSSSQQTTSGLPQVKTEGDRAIKPSNRDAPRDPVPHVKLNRIKAEYHGIEKAKFTDETLWIPIYRFPYTAHCLALIRFKVYLTLGSLLTCAYKICYCLIVPGGSLFYVMLLSSTTMLGMYVAGDFFRKLICQIYTTHDHEYIRFSRLSFFGRRIDMILPRSAVAPLTEVNTTRRKSFLTVKTLMPENIDLSYDNYEYYDEYYTLTLAFGGVLDKDNFEAALGRILSRKF